MKRSIEAPVSPIDGRYRKRTKELANYFSEPALIGYRTYMEVYYLLTLAEYAEEKGIATIPPITDEQIAFLEEFANTTAFTKEYAERVKEIEKKTNHDVKAVEYAIREILTKEGFSKELIAHVHFGLTSEDVTNIAIAHSIYDANHTVLLEVLENVLNGIWQLANTYAKMPMLSLTHGQPATPTTFGKEMMIFVQRLQGKINRIRDFRLSVKLNGPSGNYNGHMIAYPEVNWPQFAYEFIMETYKDSINEKSYFTVNQFTNQIEDHDTYAELFAIYMQINAVLKNFCKDIWMYVSRGIVGQKRVAEEVGSSSNAA